MKTLISTLLVIVVGLFAIYKQTDGFSVLTTESARRAAVLRGPVKITNTQLVSAQGDSQTFDAELRNDGRVAIVNFMYTRCPSICVAMGTEFQQLEQSIIKRDLQNKVRLISISFDERDTPEWLARYQDRMRMNTSIWQAWLAPIAAQRKELLKTFGIVAVPAPYGQFEHNAAYHIVTPDGLIRRIIDIGNPGHALYYAVQQARTNPFMLTSNGNY